MSKPRRTDATLPEEGATQQVEVPSDPSHFILTIQEVATLLKIKRTKVYDLINNEGLPYINMGDKRILFTSLQEWVKSREQRKDSA